MKKKKKKKKEYYKERGKRHYKEKEAQPSRLKDKPKALLTLISLLIGVIGAVIAFILLSIMETSFVREGVSIIEFRIFVSAVIFISVFFSVYTALTRTPKEDQAF